MNQEDHKEAQAAEGETVEALSWGETATFKGEVLLFVLGREQGLRCVVGAKGYPLNGGVFLFARHGF